MRDLGAGLRYLGQGQRWVLSRGRWFGFGLLPALITLVLYAAVLTALGFYAGDIAAWATPFADDWGSVGRMLTRGAFAVMLWLAVLMLAVVTFAAVALLIGDPFYEKLSEKVEESEGGLPEGAVEQPLWRELWTSLTDSLFVLSRTLVFTVPLFALGFVPVLGQTVIPVLGFCVSGFFLALELTSVAMQRRGIPVRERLRMLRGRKALALGFGVPLALAFLVPLLAVPLMPGAVAGATLLVRDLTGTGRGTDAGAGAPGDRDGAQSPQGPPRPAAPHLQQPPQAQPGPSAQPGPHTQPPGAPYAQPPGNPYAQPGPYHPQRPPR
ncbi:EI24 domain-containing protein [Streptomyces tubbatahanensis]|uniref:EI24 domain-containing protein n=1 Tax=Streptomyces tubbatahanensis TaxID=2923272 RepID=A0ABY3XPJ8_9ACTN|nr:EI24 domain-containing protein [Streptomyces tubbatahanensis]UNS96359.1 EI24 domain-containing protein [Streptomyces tubbatahanensis]